MNDPIKVEFRMERASFVKVWLYIVATFLVGYCVGRYLDGVFETFQDCVYDFRFPDDGTNSILVPQPPGTSA